MRICLATTDRALTLDILRYKPKGARKHGDNASFDGLCKTWCGKHRVKRYETVMFLSVGYDSSFPGHSSSRLPVLRISLEVPAFPFTAEILSNFFTACLGNFSLNFLMMPSKIPTIMRFRLASGGSEMQGFFVVGNPTPTLGVNPSFDANSFCRRGKPIFHRPTNGIESNRVNMHEICTKIKGGKN